MSCETASNLYTFFHFIKFFPFYLRRLACSNLYFKINHGTIARIRLFSICTLREHYRKNILYLYKNHLLEKIEEKISSYKMVATYFNMLIPYFVASLSLRLLLIVYQKKSHLIKDTYLNTSIPYFVTLPVFEITSSSVH